MGGGVTVKYRGGPFGSDGRSWDWRGGCERYSKAPVDFEIRYPYLSTRHHRHPQLQQDYRACQWNERMSRLRMPIRTAGHVNGGRLKQLYLAVRSPRATDGPGSSSACIIFFSSSFLVSFLTRLACLRYESCHLYSLSLFYLQGGAHRLPLEVVTRP